MTLCPECSGPVEDPTLYLAIPAIGSPATGVLLPTLRGHRRPADEVSAP